jgi:hypothetical protein
MFGTGAFTSVEAERDAAVAVANDSSAYLRLTPVPGSDNTPYVNVENGRLTVNISDETNGVIGNGVNPNATTVFDDLFRIENQGTQTIYIWILESGGRNGSKRHAFYVGDWPITGEADSAQAISVADFNNGLANTRPRELQPQSDAGIDTAAVELGVGEFVDVGLVVDTPEGSAGSAILKDGQTMTINATADREELAGVFTPVYGPSE